MKRILLTLLIVIVVLGAFAATGYAGYRMGFAQGVEQSADGEGPAFRPFERMGPGRMPMREFGFGRGWHRDRGFTDFPGWGFGFFSLFGLLWRAAILVLLVGFVYWLVTQSGWRLTRTAPTTEPPVKPTEPDAQT